MVESAAHLVTKESSNFKRMAHVWLLERPEPDGVVVRGRGAYEPVRGD